MSPSFAGLFRLKRKDTVARDHTLLVLVRGGHTRNPLQGSNLHHTMGQGAAAEVQSGHVLPLGVPAGGGAQVKAVVGVLMLFIIPGILTVTCPLDTELSLC